MGIINNENQNPQNMPHSYTTMINTNNIQIPIQKSGVIQQIPMTTQSVNPMVTQDEILKKLDKRQKTFKTMRTMIENYMEKIVLKIYTSFPINVISECYHQMLKKDEIIDYIGT